MKQSLRVFISYSHKDESYRNELEKHLSLLSRQGLIEHWHDRRIVPGQDWKKAIDRNLEKADLILCLVSADFIHSDYCFDVEMERALRRHKDGTAQVVPIIVRPCDWHAAPFSKLQALPRDGKAITSWSNQDEAWLDVAKGIRTLAESGQSAKTAPETNQRSLEDLAPNRKRRASTTAHGFCVRCRARLPLNPERPLCDRDFRSWVKYEDPDYRERFCHQCGESEADTISMRKPRCYDCWKASPAP